MKTKFLIAALATLIFATGFSTTAVAQDEDAAEALPPMEKQVEMEKEAEASKEIRISEKDKTRISNLAEASGKSVEEIQAMRVDQKMGWGRIAKELGVHPSVIGKSVAERKHKAKERHEKRQDKREERAARKERRGKNG